MTSILTVIWYCYDQNWGNEPTENLRLNFFYRIASYFRDSLIQMIICWKFQDNQNTSVTTIPQKMTMDSKTDLPMAIYRCIYCTIALFKFNQCDKFSSLTHSYRVGYFLITNDSRPIQTDSENSIGSKNFNGSDKLWKNLLFCLKDAFV